VSLLHGGCSWKRLRPFKDKLHDDDDDDDEIPDVSRLEERPQGLSVAVAQRGVLWCIGDR